MRHLTKAEWKLRYHHYRHIKWMSSNYFAYTRSMGHRSTTMHMINAAERTANNCVELRLMFGQVQHFAYCYLNKRYPSKPGYWWHTATINRPEEPQNWFARTPHPLRVEDTFPQWHQVIGASPEGAKELMAQGRKVRDNHTIKLYCGYYKQWQQRLHTPTIGGKDDAPDLAPAMGGGR